MKAALALITAVEGLMPADPPPFSGHDLLIGWNMVGIVDAQ